MFTKTVATLLFILGLPGLALAHGNSEIQSSMALGLNTDAARTVLDFRDALKAGDSKKARSFLDDKVLIFEGGGVERSADEYANHHMLADMKYIAAVDSKILEHQVSIIGDTALSTSRSKTMGTYKDKVVDYEGMETMVLHKVDNTWKIIHIHWSN